MSALITLASQVGAPFVRRILSDRLGAGNARLAEHVVEAVAERAGVAPDLLESFSRERPETVRAAIEEVERQAPDMMALAIAETKTREALLLAETAKGGWQAAWRPAGMYLIGFFWFWNVVLTELLNTVTGLGVAKVDYAILLQASAAYMALYMGGHTVKDTVKTWRKAG